MKKKKKTNIEKIREEGEEQNCGRILLVLFVEKKMVRKEREREREEK